MTRPPSLAYSNLIGTPYDVLDCWGVAREFYRLVLGMELKSYYEVIPNDDNLASSLVSTNQGDFEKVSDPKFGDIMLIRLHGLECHIGIFLGDGKFLHTSRANGCMIDRLSKWSKMISGYYRVKK